ncbi:cilia- and flagella-associated protein 251-like isoform X2 [Convolutriloba macropyga]|uniref:cilia- and flagella-associated protein 251-like isoform X2 n=1 Tax=Convolutriloba macropyga TaxID=536237 RepID=UPI003F520FBC
MSDHEDTTSTKREYEAAADEPGENAAEGGEKVTGQELGGDEAATAQQPKEEEASGQGDGDNPEGGDDANEAGAPEQQAIEQKAEQNAEEGEAAEADEQQAEGENDAALAGNAEQEEAGNGGEGEESVEKEPGESEELHKVHEEEDETAQPENQIADDEEYKPEVQTDEVPDHNAEVPAADEEQKVEQSAETTEIPADEKTQPDDFAATEEQVADSDTQKAEEPEDQGAETGDANADPSPEGNAQETVVPNQDEAPSITDTKGESETVPLDATKELETPANHVEPSDNHEATPAEDAPHEIRVAEKDEEIVHAKGFSFGEEALDSAPEQEEQIAGPSDTQAVDSNSNPPLTTTTGGPSTRAGDKDQEHSTQKTSTEKQVVASTNESIPKKPPKQLTHCLNLNWCFGVNKYCPALNMLYKLNADDPGRDSVLYTCSNIAVMYDFNENTQTLLQGHSHAITCTATSEDKRWLVTADSGKFASIIIWDTFTDIPVQTIFDPHPGSDGSGEDTGVSAIAITNDAKYIASVSSSLPQTVSIWDWTTHSGGDATASVTLNLPDSTSPQNFIMFNPANHCQLVTNSQDQVVFYLWDEGENLNYHDPQVTDKDFNRFVGTFSQSVHAPGSKWTFTATSAGNVVVWAPDKALDRQASKSPSALYKLKAFKLVKLQERALSVLTTHDQYVVTGDVVGCIKFYDNQLRMINWYQDFDRIGPINSISFAYCPGFPFSVVRNSKMPTDATIEANKFPIKDFILSTITAKIGKVQNDGTELIMISQEHDDAIYALAAHPKRSHICMGSYAGYIKIWDYEKKKVVCDLRLKPKQLVTCLAYDPSGKFLAIGFDDGNVRVLDSLTLADELRQPFAMSQKAITHIKFAHNSKYLVTADKDMCVVVYKAQFTEGSAPFVFFGKNRAHYKEITEILFGIALESDQPRLMSIGRDRVLVEYDLENSSEDDVRIASTNKIEQSGVPLCLAWYPPVMKEDFLITANDQFKLKLFNSTTKMCRKTVLGPTYGSPLTKIAVLPYLEDPFNEPRYIAFATNDRIGLHKLPVLGNPHDAMVTVAHPQGIADLCCSYDSKFVFTAGGVDNTVQMWQVKLVNILAW